MLRVPKGYERRRRLELAPHAVSSIGMTTPDTYRAIDAIWRIESPKIIAGLARIVRDVGFAQELAQDALLAALEAWFYGD